MKKYFILLFFMLLLISCKKQDVSTLDTTPTQPVVSQNTDTITDTWAVTNIAETGATQVPAKIKTADESKESTSTRDAEKASGNKQVSEKIPQDEKTIKKSPEVGANMGGIGVYKDYSEKMLGKYNKTIIFFHAEWCPSCRASDASILKWSVPAGVAILKANYDTEEDLKKKYGVTYQHTFVQVDSSGNLIKKWSGWLTLAEIIDEIK